MVLTTVQLQALKADINAAFPGAPNNSDQNSVIAAAYNAVASPDFWVWRSFVKDSDMYEGVASDSTNWSWTTFIARSQGERDAWRQMVNMKGGLNPSLVQVRNGIADIFSGAQGLVQRNYLLDIARRRATRLEKLFAAGAGSTASPAVMAAEGTATYQDIDNARNS